MAERVLVTPRFRFVDEQGMLTQDALRFLLRTREDVDEASSAIGTVNEVVGTTDTQTLTNKTMDGDLNTFLDIATTSLKSRTGDAVNVATGTAGASGNLAAWTLGGNVGDGGLAAGDVLVSADIGVTVQAYDATLLNEADIGVTVQAYDATILNEADIGVLVQAYDADLTVWAGKTAPTGTVVGTSDTQTLSNKSFSGPIIVAEYTVATVPSAASNDNGVIIVSDEVGGRTLATSDGTDWRRVSDGAIIS